MQGNRRMRVSARIQNQTGGFLARFLDPAHEISFVVRLPEIDLNAQRSSGRPAIICDCRQGLAAIDARLAFAEHIEIGTVQNEDRFQIADLLRRTKGFRRPDTL